VDAETAQEKWRFKTGKQTRASPVVVDGVVYIGSGDGYLYGIDAQTGEAIERYGVDSQIYSTPAAVGNTLYFVSGKGELYAVQRTSQPSVGEAPEIEEAAPVEPPSFQFTPGGWYILDQEPEGRMEDWYIAGPWPAIRFRGRMVDAAGNPVNGFSVQADNGLMTILSVPSGPNRWQPRQVDEGEWEIVIPGIEENTGWWWLTAVRYECATEAAEFDPQCQKVTRLSESIKVEITQPDEMAINADWTCHWGCQNSDEK
jgi:hypothetical protein